MTIGKRILAVEPTPVRFARDTDEQGLVRFLHEREASEPERIRKVDNLLIDQQNYRVQGRYQLTTVALSQLCSLLCPGFGQAIFDISGLRKSGSEGSPQRGYSIRKAVDDLNQMLRFRGEVLIGHGLVMDKRTGRIEGIVGPEYHYFSNAEFWERVQQFVTDAGTPVRFYEAIYSNRRLTIRYRTAQPVFVISSRAQQSEPFYGGWHFSNSEIGDCAIHMGVPLVRAWSRSVALIFFSDIQKLIHRGIRRRFMGKLEDMFDKLQGKMGAAAECKQPVQELQQCRLGLGGDFSGHARRVKGLIRGLIQGKLPRRLAKDVINHVLFRGSYKTDIIRQEDAKTPLSYAEAQQGVAMEAYEARTVYDLFNALTICARKERPERQELAEQLAYKVLRKQFVP